NQAHQTVKEEDLGIMERTTGIEAKNVAFVEDVFNEQPDDGANHYRNHNARAIRLKPDYKILSANIGRCGDERKSDIPANQFGRFKHGVLLSFLSENKNNESYRSEEHTSELQSRENLVCRLLLEKKK